MELGRHLDIVAIEAEGNHLSYRIENEVDKAMIKIFDPTGEHGAENALDCLTESGCSLRTEVELLRALFTLELNSRGQFEIMEFNVGVSR